MSAYDATSDRDPEAVHFEETWSAFQSEIIDTSYPKTAIVRQGWPKPTIYREHEVIHVLCNVIDNLRRQLDETKDRGLPGQT